MDKELSPQRLEGESFEKFKERRRWGNSMLDFYLGYGHPRWNSQPLKKGGMGTYRKDGKQFGPKT